MTLRHVYHEQKPGTDSLGNVYMYHISSDGSTRLMRRGKKPK